MSPRHHSPVLPDLLGGNGKSTVRPNSMRAANHTYHGRCDSEESVFAFRDPVRRDRSAVDRAGEASARPCDKTLPLRIGVFSKGITRAPASCRVAHKDAVPYQQQDVTQGRILRTLGELSIFGGRQLPFEALE